MSSNVLGQHCAPPMHASRHSVHCPSPGSLPRYQRPHQTRNAAVMPRAPCLQSTRPTKFKHADRRSKLAPIRRQPCRRRARRIEYDPGATPAKHSSASIPPLLPLWRGCHGKGPYAGPKDALPPLTNRAPTMGPSHRHTHAGCDVPSATAAARWRPLAQRAH